MNDWEKFNKTSLPKKEEFYNNFGMEDNTEADYMYAKRVCKDLEIKTLGEYHDLNLKKDTLLLNDVFENFREICLKTYHLHPAKFLSDPGLARQADLKKTKSKVRIFNWYWYAIDMSCNSSICKS